MKRQFCLKKTFLPFLPDDTKSCAIQSTRKSWNFTRRRRDDDDDDDENQAPPVPVVPYINGLQTLVQNAHSISIIVFIKRSHSLYDNAKLTHQFFKTGCSIGDQTNATDVILRHPIPKESTIPYLTILRK